MIPKYHSITELEKLAANDSPCSSGAWWIMLQTAQSVLNSAVEQFRDPVNNKVLDQFWKDLYEESSVNDYFSIAGNRPLPYDDLMQIISYCGEQLEEVIKFPRHKIVKENIMVTPNKLKSSSQKTMNWLGKQPGRTIREKVAGKNKILTETNVYSYDVKENQVALSLYKDLYKKTKPRIENREAYSLEYDSPNIKKIKRIKKSLRGSNLENICAKKHTDPNNVLLSDKSYSVIWKAFLDVCKFDKNLAEYWTVAKKKYVKAAFISILVELLKYEEVILIDELVNIQESNELGLTVIIGVHWNNPMIVSLKTAEEKIYITVSDYYCDKAQMVFQKEYQIKFLSGDEKKIVSKRGYPIELDINSGEEHLEIYADKGGIEDICNWIVSKISYFYGEKLCFKEEKKEQYEGSVVLDLLSDGKECLLGDNKIVVDFSANAIVYDDDQCGERKFKQSRHSVYKNSKYSATVHNALDSNANTVALDYCIKNIWDLVNIGQEDYLLYLIPDSLEEFRQRKIKQSISSCFPREKTFPIWRSVAAITYKVYETGANIVDGDYVLSIDLMDESATSGLCSLSYDKGLRGLICNHYPPFSQIDEGDVITEKAFYLNYLYRYFESQNMRISKHEAEEIVASGLVETVIRTHDSYNYVLTKPDIHIMRVKYDEYILSECINEFIKKFVQYVKCISGLLPKKDIVHLNIMSDSIIHMLTDDEYFYLESSLLEVIRHNCRCMYVSSCETISEGALLYRDRLRQHLPTWTEYLPELSLEVIKDGRYAQLELIGKDVSFDVMGEDNEHLVDEQLILKANETEFRFPLIKKDISKNSVMVEAYVSDKSFPLDHDVVVNLSVKYKYGFDNSYELLLTPSDSKESSFKEIVVEWNDVNSQEQTSNIWPPNINNQNIEILIKTIETTRKSLEISEERIGKQFVGYDGSWDIKPTISQIDYFLNQNLFRIRNIVMSDCYEAEEFIKWFIDSKLYKYLGEIGGVFKRNQISSFLFSENEGKELNLLIGDALQLMFSLGGKTPKVLQEYFIKSYFNFDSRYRMKVMVDLLMNNRENVTAIETLIEDVKSVNDLDSYSMKMDGLVKELGRMCCFDSELIHGFYVCDKQFVNEIVEFIIKGIGKIIGRFEYYNGQYPKENADRKRYIAYAEAILALLRLRNPDKCVDFDLLIVGSEQSKRLANMIKKLDNYMKNPRSGVRLKIDKPEALSNMSDLAYALDLYLNGDKKAAYIEVVGIEDIS